MKEGEEGSGMKKSGVKDKEERKREKERGGHGFDLYAFIKNPESSEHQDGV